MGNSDFWKNEWSVLERAYFDGRGEIPFPWTKVDPMSGKIYTFAIEYAGYDENIEAYQINVMFSWADEEGNSDCLSDVSNIYEADVETFFDNLIELLKDNYMMPADDINFSLDIYDYCEGAKDKSADELYEYIMAQCNAAHRYYNEEEQRSAFFQTQKEELEERKK